MKKATAQMALDYLSNARTMSQYANLDDLLAADQVERAALIAALEMDIAQAVEPVSWQVMQDGEWEWCKSTEADFYKKVGYQTRPLYAAPAAPDVNAELLEALKRLEVSANTVAYCCDKVPENFASALTGLQDDAANARDVMANATGSAT